MSSDKDIRRLPDRQQMFDAIAEHLKVAIVASLEGATKSCLTCDHFNEPGEICRLYQARPPARIIAFGCPSYVDEIPF